MIRYRKPKQDDPVILGLIETQLVPLSNLPQTVLNQLKKDMPLRLKHGVTFVTCYKNKSKPQGFIHFMLHGDLLYIDMLAIAPAAQRKHRGKKLMERAEKFALSRGCRRAKISVDYGNTGGLAFYQKLDYRIARYLNQSYCYELEKQL